MLSDVKKGSNEDDEYELLTVLIKHYEEVHFPTPPPDPVEAILFSVFISQFYALSVYKIRNSKHEIRNPSHPTGQTISNQE